MIAVLLALAQRVAAWVCVPERVRPKFTPVIAANRLRPALFLHC